MTRFARVQGVGKPSFNKVAEDATPWEVLKQPVEECSDDEEEAEDKEIENEVENEDKTISTPGGTVWCEFKEKPSPKNNSKKRINDSFNRKEEKKARGNEFSGDCVNPPNDNYNVNKENTGIDDLKRKNKKSTKTESDVNEHTKEEEITTKEHEGGITQCDSAEGEGKPYKRRKPDEGDKTVVIDGQEIKIVRFNGFYVKEDDANRLKEMKRKLKKNNVSKEKIQFLIKKERQKAEKALARMKKKLCFNCRQYGHSLSTCPTLTSNGICYKCGSTEHSMFQCKAPWNELKFATCFICKEQGHLSKNCPDNPRGLYPNGGGCRLCGDVTHLKQDCPKTLRKNKNINKVLSVDTFKKGKFSVDEDYQENAQHKKVNPKNNFSRPKPKKITYK